ncbi:MAG: hypothetical protein ABSH00_10630 [Bryobacteraceae bacterium]
MESVRSLPGRGSNGLARVSVRRGREVLLALSSAPSLSAQLNSSGGRPCAPGMLCGVDQINMWVPSYAQGTYLFFPKAGGTGSGVGVTIAVQ